MHFCPSPVYPGVHVQAKDPWVLLQNASELQLWASATHSSIFQIRFILNNGTLSGWKTKIYLTWAEKISILANAIVRSLVVPDLAFPLHLFVLDPQSIFGQPLLYSVTVWMCLQWYHSRDLKFEFFFLFFTFFTIIVNIRFRWYCVISKVGLPPTLLTLSWIKLWQDASPLTKTSFMYLHIHHLYSSIRLPCTQVYMCSCRILWCYYKLH